MRGAEEIIQDARREISAYCLESCDADCCKRGGLRVSESDAPLFGEVGACRILLNPCPNLDGSRCSIYDQRPDTCANFPIRIARLGERDVVTIGVCRAIESGVIDSQLSDLAELKYETFNK